MKVTGSLQGQNLSSDVAARVGALGPVQLSSHLLLDEAKLFMD